MELLNHASQGWSRDAATISNQILFNEWELLMKKSIFISGMAIMLVVAFTAVATFAYFGNTREEEATISTAKIEIGQTSNFPLEFTNMLPGEVKSQNVAIYNSSTTAADLFFQMLAKPAEGEANFCLDLSEDPPVPDEVLDIRIKNRDTGNWIFNWKSICPLYPGQPNSIIQKLGDDLPPNTWLKLTVEVRLTGDAGNDLQNSTNTDIVHLIAVQYNGPAPKPVKTGFPTVIEPWPKDDDNYD
ncbi:MAG: hypothetical protein ACK2U1_24450 [Anaerolineales bacterium]